MASIISKVERGMLDLIRSLLTKMRNHSTKRILVIHVTRAQRDTFDAMRKKFEKDRLEYAGVEFKVDEVLVDGVQIKYKGGK